MIMENVILMYNPKSGDTSFRFHLDSFIESFSKKGYIVHVLRSCHKGDMEKYLNEAKLEDCQGIFVAGGDGSVNEAINGMLKNNIDIPLGIVPAGTANDFANCLKIPTDFDECVQVLSKMKIQEVDVGKASERYFINVCCGGLFTNVSQNIDIDLKNTLGKMAYYLKGAEQIYNIKPIHLNIIADEEEYDEDFYIFLVLNSTGAGGFYHIAPSATIDDGYFDLVAVRTMTSIKDFPRMLMSLIKGDHLNDPNILHRKCQHIEIKSDNFGDAFNETDVDGERGPDLPIILDVIPKGLKVFINPGEEEKEEDLDKEEK